MSATWFSGLSVQPGAPAMGEPPLRLFCFPHAGGGSRFYNLWRQRLAPQVVEVCAIVLPGRDGRLLEPPYTRMEPLVSDLVEALRPHLDRPFAFFGHSLGAAVAYETAHRLRQLGLPQPRCLFASGRRAPHSPVPPPFTHQLSDADLVSEVLSLNGLPEKALRRPRALEAILPSLRADYQINDTYLPSAGLRLAFPVYAYAGDDDPLALPVDVAGWRLTTTGAFRVRVFPGDHFYLRDAPPDFATAVLADLREAALLGVAR
ncbi:thioesterase II family protein [Dactylosporangium sp. NPDC048998]|uniref:thioesterase II family protein n=1 Tax=Dactylosporangium sp. NPDC048998 TaxID=3363976 RepID=UPI00371D53A2